MAVKKAKPQRQDASTDFCVYLGPTARGIVQRGTIYPENRDTVLKAMTDESARFPELRHLIVAGRDLADARKAIKTPGTLLYTKYAAMRSRTKEE